MAKDRRECDAVGMNDYLSKPVSIEMLSTCINRFFPES
jgi:CheY-like chemotaxis protein